MELRWRKEEEELNLHILEGVQNSCTEFDGDGEKEEEEEEEVRDKNSTAIYY